MPPIARGAPNRSAREELAVYAVHRRGRLEHQCTERLGRLTTDVRAEVTHELIDGLGIGSQRRTPSLYDGDDSATARDGDCC
jgi:hypothetical protein